MLGFAFYTFANGVTFFVGLCLSWWLYWLFPERYLYTSAFVFLVITGVNYAVYQFWVFRGSTVSVRRGVIGTFLVAVCGLAVLTVGVYVLVEWLHMPYVPARCLTLAGIGVGSYFLEKHTVFGL